MYQSGKVFSHVVSTCFRQWRANSHCGFLHGYGLTFEYAFQTKTLDNKNWVIDFGGLKLLKNTLEQWFDHKTVVAKDDPQIEWFREGMRRGILDLVEVDHLSCESFAKLGFDLGYDWLGGNQEEFNRVALVSCTVREHEANWASYTNPNLENS